MRDPRLANLKRCVALLRRRGSHLAARRVQAVITSTRAVAVSEPEPDVTDP